MQLTDGKLEVEGQKEGKPPAVVSLWSLGDREDSPPSAAMVPFDLRGTQGALIVHMVLKGYCPGSSQRKGSPAWFPPPRPPVWG